MRVESLTILTVLRLYKENNLESISQNRFGLEIGPLIPIPRNKLYCSYCTQLTCSNIHNIRIKKRNIILCFTFSRKISDLATTIHFCTTYQTYDTRNIRGGKEHSFFTRKLLT